MDIFDQALAYAKHAHRNQKRKYTGVPYYLHCLEVGELLKTVTDKWQIICAGYLHDTIEDTDAKLEEIATLFGHDVANLVIEVTDKSRPEDGNRQERKRIDREAIWDASADAQLIKLADLISNTQSIRIFDRAFAKVYLEEKRLLLSGICKELPLYKLALSIVRED